MMKSIAQKAMLFYLKIFKASAGLEIFYFT